VLLPQELLAVTFILPFWPVFPVFTVIVSVPCPLVMLQPVGTVHVYVVALGTAEILYVWLVPGQTEILPEIVPGIAGVPGSIEIANVEEGVAPHPLLAITLNEPSSPVVPVVTVKEVVPWPEKIDHPDGTVHVYVVASGIATTV
jgi:hypothetical protein